MRLSTVLATLAARGAAGVSARRHRHAPTIQSSCAAAAADGVKCGRDGDEHAARHERATGVEAELPTTVVPVAGLPTLGASLRVQPSVVE